MAVSSGVETVTDLKHANQELPRRRSILWVTFTDREVGAQDVALLRQSHL